MTRSSTPSSSPSVNCHRTEPLPLRLPWRPSRVLQIALALIGLGAGVSLWLSEMPWPIALAATPFVVALTVHRIALERRQASREFLIDAGGVASLDGQPLDAATIRWRGPIAILRWRAGETARCLLWWPDTLPSAARRELRLAAPALAARPLHESMAP